MSTTFSDVTKQKKVWTNSLYLILRSSTTYHSNTEKSPHRYTV